MKKDSTWDEERSRQVARRIARICTELSEASTNLTVATAATVDIRDKCLKIGDSIAGLLYELRSLVTELPPDVVQAIESEAKGGSHSFIDQLRRKMDGGMGA